MESRRKPGRRKAIRAVVLVVPVALGVFARPAGHAVAQEAAARPKRAIQVRDPRELYGPTPVTRAVERGLRFLQSAQLADGSWLSNYGEEGKNTGIIGLSVLAFLSAGHEAGRGDYGTVIDRAVAFLLRNRKQGMLIRDRDTSHGPMYEHGIATLVLGEVAGMIEENRAGFENFTRIHQSAVNLILRAQDVPRDRSYMGGWRYTPTSDQADLSVTGWQILALRAAQDAGLSVPQRSIDRAVLYVKRCASPDGGFLYDPLQSRKPNAAMTGTGLLALELCGAFESEEALRAGDWILKNPIDWKTPFFYYSMYYSTQAMYQLGGKHWETFRPTSEGSLLEKQKPDGSWELPPNIHEQEAGYAYSTSMAILALSVEFKCLPIYQR